MQKIELHVDVPEADLLDASEEIRRLIELDPELCAPLRGLLLGLDDAITDAFSAERAAA
ncbi:MAG TPA: hypothetical protein VFL66_02075 [Gaiellaceae bacterium]|nr:hypothetical protein [Gaiellaceae bacterium]